MNILVINHGSSSLKCALYRMSHLREGIIPSIWHAHVDFDEGTIKMGDRMESLKGRTPGAALAFILKDIGPIDVIGHRIVHGGNKYKESVRITPAVKKNIRLFAELAPLHNRADLEGIEILEKKFKKTPQIAVFDTAFHHTLPQENIVYPVPYKWYKEGIQRYGFHGINFQYCTRRCKEILKRDLKLIICHLGSGASLCAVKDGKSIDTTMGFTPLEGLMMDTRSGTIDPGIILHLLKKKTPAELTRILYKESGLLGLSGFSSDMRSIIDKQKSPRAKLAFDVYIHRLNTMIGSMISSLNGMDALIFTAGIGENAALVRKRVCEAFSFLGVKLDEKKIGFKQDGILSSADSKIKVLVIHAGEAFEIARECWKKVKNV